MNIVAARRVALVVAFSLFLQMLDGAIIATSLPQMAEDFGVEPLEMSVGVTIYLLTGAIFVPIAGWLGDRVGAVKVFLCAILLFTLASVGCGLATSLTEFVGARAIQGIGGAFMVPVARVIVLRNAEKSQVIEVMALLSWPALVAPVIGPSLGGAITTYFSWRWNFLMNLPLGLIGFFLVLSFVRVTTPRVERPFDWLGFLFCAVALACLLVGLESFVHLDDALWLPAMLVPLGIVSAFLAILRLRHARHPLLDLGAFRYHTFAMANLWAATLARVAINAVPFLLPLFFQVVYGLDALQAGGLIMGYFAGNLAMKTITSAVLRRFGFRTVLIVNGFGSAACIAACALLAPGTPFPLVVGLLAVTGFARSMQFTSLSTLSFADIPADARSSATTLAGMIQQTAQVFAVAYAAFLLDVSRGVQHHATLTYADFQVAFIGVAAVGLISAALLFRLDAHAGAEIAGRPLS